MAYIFPKDLTQIEPLMFEVDEAFSAKCYALDKVSTKLSALIHPISAEAVSLLVSSMNCYYSNLIEGHNTKPVDIERAMAGDFSSVPEKRLLQLEAKAHIDVERLFLEQSVSDDVLFSQDFISSIHREFYSRLPEDLHIAVSGDGGRQERVVPGQLRASEVQVGRHYPPQYTAVPEFMSRFQSAYLTAWRAGKLPYQRLPIIACSHHRLLWIHPFLDGNGRAARLFAVLAMKAAGIDGIGLWSPSRGLARRVEEYKALLQDADSLRRGDLDGRGNLSLAALKAFSAFYVDVCLDQVLFMTDMFELDGLTRRVENFFSVMSSMMPIKKEGYKLVVEAIVRGEFSRGEASRITGLGERVARDVLGDLIKRGFLKSDSVKGPVRVAFPAMATGYYFPNLFPAGSISELTN
jgi:Fic family protein